MKTLLSLLAVLFLSACATEDLTASGSKVMLVTAITPTDLEGLEEVGRGSCTEIFPVLDPEESCRNQLRNGAASLGADFVLVESLERTVCLGQQDKTQKSCVHGSGRAYKKKSSSLAQQG